MGTQNQRGAGRVADFPDVTRADCECAVLSPWYLGEAAAQRQSADAVASEWDAVPWPEGLISANCFASLDDEVLLLYFQWSDEAARRAFFASPQRQADAVAAFGLAESPGYRVYRSLGNAATAPTSLITATFDVDGPKRQRHIADSLCEAAARMPRHPAGLSSHFHLSADGTRVVNYTEWNDDAAHDEVAEDGDFDEAYRISTDTPGVRATRGRQYRLWHSRSVEATCAV